MSHEQVDTRSLLLDAAEELFSRKGYAAVGIREIVEHADVNIAAIKYHFGSKSELYTETVRRAMERRETASAWESLQARPPDPQMAATVLVRFIHRFLARRLAPDSPDTAGSLILHEAVEPSEAIDAVVRDFIQPHESMLVEVLSVLAPDADRRQLSFFGQSVLGQILHYRVFRPVLERMAIGNLADREQIRQIADHIARFSLRGLGCPPEIIERALAEGRATTVALNRSSP
ncbi:MAG: TetR/AcrR family transcriptional regulator [Planctomycetota bacterium]|jgi:AcrR family transcriptional regulator